MLKQPGAIIARRVTIKEALKPKPNKKKMIPFSLCGRRRASQHDRVEKGLQAQPFSTEAVPVAKTSTIRPLPELLPISRKHNINENRPIVSQKPLQPFEADVQPENMNNILLPEKPNENHGGSRNYLADVRRILNSLVKPNESISVAPNQESTTISIDLEDFSFGRLYYSSDSD